MTVWLLEPINVVKTHKRSGSRQRQISYNVYGQVYRNIETLTNSLHWHTNWGGAYLMSGLARGRIYAVKVEVVLLVKVVP